MKSSKALGKKQKIIISSIGVALLLVVAVDNWLPYALLSHHKYAVVAHPPILDALRC